MSEIGPILLVLAAQISIPVAGGLLLSRRRDPAAACGPLVLAAACALILTPLAFIPRSAWSGPDSAPASVAKPDGAADPAAHATTPGPVPGGIDVMELLRLSPPAPADRTSGGPDWWLIAAYGFLGLAAVGIGRLAVGVVLVTRAARAGRPVTDDGLLALAAELRTALGCGGTFQLCETDRVGTAATVGWSRAVILVSPAWRLWGPGERRAALAHEIAHVARGDFLARLVARVAVAMHSYHPLVRWLAARLELRQEMAADAQAAGPCGGRPAYLKSLAALALRTEARPLAAAPAFLSRPRTLLRRIAMLRVTDDSPARSRRWPALAVVTLLAAAALGLHGSTPDALAGPVVRAGATAEAQRPPLDASFVLPSDQPDEVGVYAVRLGALLRTPGMEKMAEGYGQLIKSVMGDKKTRFEANDIEQVCGRVSLTHDSKKPAPNRALSLSLSSVRMEKDFDWVGQLKEWCSDWKEHTHSGVKYYSGKMSVPMLGFKDTTVWWYLPDSRTAVMESEENIKRLIGARGKPAAAPWADDWKALEGGMVAVVISDLKKTVAPKLSTDESDDPAKKSALKAFAAICARATRAAIGFDVGDGCSFKVRLACASAMDASDVDAGCQAIVKLAQTALEGEKGAPTDPLEKAEKRLTTMLVRGIEFGKTVDHIVELRTSSTGGFAEYLKALSAATTGK